MAADPALQEVERAYHRQHKARIRSTPEGKRAQYLSNKRYIERHRDKVNRYYRQRGKESPDFAMSRWMRSTLHKVLTRANSRKDAKAAEILGYTREELRNHIEAQFLKGMGWHNRDEWHIDHIVPVAEMLRRGVTDPAEVNALSNLRPLWAKDNHAKSDKVLSLL